MAIIISSQHNSELYQRVVDTNLIRQADFLRLSFDVALNNGFIITTSFLRDLHYFAMTYLVEQPGQFRDFAAEIRGSSHVPPSHDKIIDELNSFTSVVREKWNEWDEIRLAAYIKWKFDWIHPFEDGNGRVSRALTYFVLCCKAGMLFRGKYTVMEQLRVRRNEVFDALEKTHIQYNNAKNICPDDVVLYELESLLVQMIEKQFLSADLIN